MSTQLCRECGRPVVWARGRKGVWTALERAPDGRYMIRPGTPPELLPYANATPDEQAVGLRYETHITRCPAR